ncbi:MAG: T9SS type A sorting domain-containing protein [Bacteroidia bacterium]
MKKLLISFILLLATLNIAQAALEIDNDLTIAGPFFPSDDIIIKDGAKLTLTGILYMNTGAKIIVEQGCKLLMNGGTITSAGSDLWLGIEVWGNSALSQFGSSNQGTILMLNGSLIEHAHEAIQAWRPGHWDKTGGIVRVHNSSIINCKRAASFMKYSNDHLGNHYQNKSEFKDVEFIWNNGFRRAEALEMVSMYKVDGISFNACRFEDLRSILNVDKRSHGIHALDASFSVTSSCTSLSGCPDDITDPLWNLSRFTNLDNAILIGNAYSYNSVTVDRCQFKNNLIGVNKAFSNYAEITRNLFLYTSDMPSDVSASYGIRADYCDGYRIEENIFKDIAATTPFTFGVYITNSGDQDNQTYKNAFDNLHVAHLADGMNRYLGLPHQNGRSGLEFICNENENNNYDFRLNGSGTSEGVKRTNGIYVGSGNTFSLFGPFAGHILNATDHKIEYYYGLPGGEPTHIGGDVDTWDTDPIFNQCLSMLPNYPIGESGLMSQQALQSLHMQFNQVNQLLSQRITALDAMVSNGTNTNISTYQDEIDHLASEEAFMADILIQQYKRQGDLTAMRSVIANQFNSLKALNTIDSYYHDEDFTTANQLLNQLATSVTTYPSHLQSDVSTFVNLKTTLNQQAQTSGGIANLNNQKQQQLKQIATQGEGFAKAQAQNILCFFYNDCPDYAPASTNRDAAPAAAQVQPLAFTVAPNPANKVANISWENNDDEVANIRIMDITGHLIFETQLTETNFRWETDNLSAGTYLVSVRLGNRRMGTQKVVVVK